MVDFELRQAIAHRQTSVPGSNNGTGNALQDYSGPTIPGILELIHLDGDISRVGDYVVYSGTLL